MWSCPRRPGSAGDILAEDDTSYLVKAAPTSEEDTRILRDGDQVVLASAELTDGKVVR